MKCDRTGSICAVLVASGTLLFAIGAPAVAVASEPVHPTQLHAGAQVEGDDDSSGSDAPLWIGIATGLGAAAALGFALWPAWRRGRGDQPATSDAPGVEPNAGGPPVADTVAIPEAAAVPNPGPDIDAAVSQGRARLRAVIVETSEHQARSLERVAAQQTQALLGSASAVRAELEALVGEWQTRLETTAAKAASQSNKKAGATQDELARLRVATEAFERLRRVQQQALAEIVNSRQEGLAALEASRLEVERLSNEYQSALDAAGAQWLRRIEKAGKQASRRRRRVSPPVVGVFVAVAIAVGGVAIAVGGDNQRSGAGPQLRAQTVPSTSTTTTTTTTAPPATEPPTTTAALPQASAAVPQTPRTTRPVVTAPATAPPVVTAAPQPVITDPPRVAPSPPTPPTFPASICQYVPAFC